jgi:Mn2+/Fe2+ NRAMP family transporter
MRIRPLLRAIAPGILVAATGIGAGDLATASFTGSVLGLTILWAVLLGAFMKFVLNEGLARWQLATGSTLLEGCVERLGWPVRWIFLLYLWVWSFFVAGALMSAVGVTAHAIYPLTKSVDQDKVVYGVLHSVLAVAMVRLGGYRLFERVMGVCIAIMFVTVLATAIALRPDLSEFVRGLLVLTIPNGGTAWTIALIGGVGGTVTVLCYGYWIREEGRTSPSDLPTCRIDLAAGYSVTALFGLSMVVIGSSLGELSGGGATLVVEISRQLEETFGSAGGAARWAFLAGAYGAVFSSMLGVWQSVPYLFADLWQMRHGTRLHDKVDTSALPYRGYLYAIASVPVLGMAGYNFRLLQQTYAVIGAAFIPMLAAILLILNGRGDWVGPQHKNSWPTVLVLLGTLLFFAYAAVTELGK